MGQSISPSVSMAADHFHSPPVVWVIKGVGGTAYPSPLVYRGVPACPAAIFLVRLSFRDIRYIYIYIPNDVR